MFEASPQSAKTDLRRGDGFALGSGLMPAADLRWLWQVIWNGKSVIVLATAAGLALSVLVVLFAPHKFTATTQILIDPTDLHAIGNAPSPTSQGNDSAVLSVESQVRVLTSENVLRRVVDAEDLAHDPDFVTGSSGSGALLSDLAAALGLRRASSAGDAALAALNELRRRIQVKRAERTYVVDVSVSDRDPAKAAHLANAVATAYLAEQTQVRADAARQLTNSLTGRLKELRDHVHEAETRVERYKADNNIVGANGQLVDEQQLSDLNNQLVAARARTADAKARYEQVQGVQRAKDELGAFPEALQSQTITALRSQYAEIMRREAEQTTTLGARHPAVIDIEAQAERLRRLIDDEISRTAQAMRNAYESAKADEAILAHDLEAAKATTTGTNGALIGLRELERDVQASREIYQSFLVRARETGAQEQLDTKNIRVISAADLPQRRSSPPPSLLMALAGLLLGAATGTGIVLLRAAQGTATGASAGGPAGAVKGALAGTIPILAVLPNVDVSFGLNAVANPRSHYATEIGKIRAALSLDPKKSGHAAVLVVASGNDDDAAAVTLALAASAAATQRVLVIDADLQGRTLAALDADDSGGGLVDIAVGHRTLNDVVHRDRGTNINLAPVVSQQSRRDQQIRDEDIQQAFDQTRRFDLVIVAAVNLSANPLIRFFARLVDDIVLIARSEEQYDGGLERFAASLGGDAEKVRGAVLTGVGLA